MRKWLFWVTYEAICVLAKMHLFRADLAYTIQSIQNIKGDWMMKRTIWTLALLPTAAFAQSLSFRIDLPAEYEGEGALRVALFTSQATFDAGDPAYGQQIPAAPGSNFVHFDGVPAGTYGASVFLDRNSNETLDFNLLGMPTEPFGFSLDPNIWFSAPTFDKFAFGYDGQDDALIISLNGI